MTERSEVSAGGVVYRRVGSGIEVAIAEQRDRITHRTTTRLPKGKIDPGESAEDAAVREVVEEIGLRTRVVGALGSVEYDYAEDSERVCKEVHYFLMEWVPGESLELDGEMAKIDGPTLVREVRGERPDLKVIFISGYAEDAFRKRLDQDSGIHFLPKPFSLKQLAGKVKEVMAEDIAAA